VVEDSETQAESLRRAFTAHGYIVFWATGGEEGRRLFQAHHPELVVLDYDLPDMTGDQLLAEFKQSEMSLSVIIITANPTPELALRLIRQGADSYVHKPFMPDYLLHVCEKTRRQRALLRVEKILEQRTRELRDSEQRYRDLFKQAQEHERQRTEFLAMLTHDIRNPLGVVLGYLDMLREEPDAFGVPPAAELIQRMESNMLTIHALVTNYLDFSTIEAGRLTLAKQPLRLNELLSQLERRHESEATHHRITLQLQVPPQLPSIEADPLALERIFTNLLHNALKFTPEAGRVTVSVTLYATEIAVAVSDTGPGIAPDDLALLFRKYGKAATLQRRQGTGLGLFIVKELTEAHGGRVEVQSTVGQGSTFTVFLPLKATAE
jgi:signal transduction histidine kinase